jgi:threonine dehydrogenase-like Zn-dependent dehydrogenase/GT2 family glycosyltransferase
MSRPSASIVVRAFNEERHLGRLLERLAAQTVRSHEVIVVDSGSFDRTRQIAVHQGARLLEVASEDFTFGYSLNVGVRAARAPLVAIVSAHTEPLGRQWLEGLLAPFADASVAMAYGRQVGAPQSKLSEALDFERTYKGLCRFIMPDGVFANNANSAIRRALWEQHQFDERLPGLEDIAWAKHWLERGLHVVYEPDAAIAHIHEETWSQVHHRYFREAVAARHIGVRGLRHVPVEAARETTRFVLDLGAAASRGLLRERAGEILRFRWQKASGTVTGLLSDAGTASHSKRQNLFFDRDYQAVVIRGPHKAGLERVSVPPIAPRDVLVRVAFVGVCGTDLEILEGTLGYFKTGLCTYPITPGHEFSGTVARIGARVEGIETGQPVVVECIQSCMDCDVCRKGNFIACAKRREVGVMRRDGAYAEYVAVPARFVHTLPLGTDLKRAALCEPIAVALKGIRRVDQFLAAGADVACAVVGGGPVGYLSAQILRHRGHRVTVFDREEARRRVLRGAGLDVTDDLCRVSDYDIVVEATGDRMALQTILTTSRPGATILLLGLPYARHDFTFEDIVAYDKAVVGSVGSTAADFREAVRLLPQLPLDPLTDAVRPLAQFDQVWAAFRGREHLKVLLQA